MKTKKEVISNIFYFLDIYESFFKECKIPLSQVKNYRKVRSYKELLEIEKYLNDVLMEPIKSYKLLWNYFPPDAWERFKILKPDMPEFKELKELRAKVKACWESRPHADK